MADAASRAGHVQAAAGAVGLSSWRRRPLARPQAAHSMLARQAERPPLPDPAAQGMKYGEYGGMVVLIDRLTVVPALRMTRQRSPSSCTQHPAPCTATLHPLKQHSHFSIAPPLTPSRYSLFARWMEDGDEDER
eukprot:scaffold20780_cov101-Isochrysis_galbana.AAC.2